MTLGQEPESSLSVLANAIASSELSPHPSTAELLKDALISHAAPLMPLRARDLQALIDLFQHDEIEAIEADIIHNLLKRRPTPQWEELESELLHNPS